jgi:RecB family exonuclease
MESFLGKVASEVLLHYKDEIHRTIVVLPTRRACLFFRKELSSRLSSPALSPEIFAVNDFILSLSPFTVPDRTELITLLYLVYKKHFPQEDFDKFYPWGGMLLNDFDETDRWLCNAEKLFSTLKALKDIDEKFGLPEEETERLRKFAEMFFAGAEGKIKNEFSAFWNKLLPVYSEFKNLLSEKNLAYEGMVYRTVAETISSEENIKKFHGRHFIFAGFYALSSSEEKIISHLKKNYGASVYWDSDPYYYENKNHEAGHFLRDSSLIGKNNFNWNENHFANSGKKNIKITGVPLQVGQAKAAGVIVKNLLKENSPEQIAVVLPDERMLLPVMHSLPPEADRINITMGYPLSQTSLRTLLETWFTLQKHRKQTDKGNLFYHKQVKDILTHPYTTALEKTDSERLYKKIEEEQYVLVPQEILCPENAPPYRKIIFSEINSAKDLFSSLLTLLELLLSNAKDHASVLPGEFSDIDIESIALLYSRCIRLEKNILTYIPETEWNTAANLVMETVRTSSIPFSGEPLNGLQVMGFLETRALDFENVILLNVNEGTLPYSSRQNSFIAYPLRKSFGLPLFTEKDAVSSYHFYRLLQRAKNIFLLYDTEVKKLATGEKSRFILQLIHEMKDVANVSEELITAPIRIPDVKPIVIEKDAGMMEEIQRYFIPAGKQNASPSFSASKLQTYINCPTQFYFRYIAHLKATEDVADEIDEKTFGTLLHECMRELYGDIKILDQKTIEELRKKVSSTVATVFAELVPQKASLLFGKNLLLKKTAEELIYKLLDADAKDAPLELLFLERKAHATFSLGNGKSVNLYGIIDRAEKVNGHVRITDYKTGRVNGIVYKNIEELFSSTDKKELFQLMFYGLLSSSFHSKPVAAGIYILRDMSEGIRYLNGDNTPVSQEKMDAFRARLTELINEITDEKTPFIQTEDKERCRYCEFADICTR